jgi:hypothetical protein
MGRRGTQIKIMKTNSLFIFCNSIYYLRVFSKICVLID